MGKTKTESRVSELEGCALGVLARLGPCTAYAVRKEFARSLTEVWRASAGAVYPLLARLTRLGFIAESKVRGDGRGSTLLSLTEKGRSALVEWLTDKDPDLAGATPDPLRTRYQFVTCAESLGTGLIEGWMESSQSALRAIRQRTAAEKSQGNAVDAAASRAAELQVEARIKWLRELLKASSVTD